MIFHFDMCSFSFIIFTEKERYVYTLKRLGQFSWITVLIFIGSWERIA